MDAAEGAAGREVSGIQGGAFVVRRHALEATGGWYSAGFLYHEDVELSWTLRLMGYRIAFVPTPRVEHHYSLTMSPEKLFLLERNRWETLLANTRWTTRLLISPFLLWTELMMWTYCASRGCVDAGSRRAELPIDRQRRGVIAERRAMIARLRRVPDRHVLRARSVGTTRGTSWCSSDAAARRGGAAAAGRCRFDRPATAGLPSISSDATDRRPSATHSAGPTAPHTGWRTLGSQRHPFRGLTAPHTGWRTLGSP